MFDDDDQVLVVEADSIGEAEAAFKEWIAESEDKVDQTLVRPCTRFCVNAFSQ